MNSQRPGDGGRAYSVPTSAAIAANQNDLGPLRLLLAQRRLYSKAKGWATLRAVGIGMIGVSGPLLTAAWPETAVVVGAVAGSWMFASRTLFMPAEKKLAARGAQVQEQFDVTVFEMPQLALREPRVSAEEVSLLVGTDEEVTRAAQEQDLRDWYPIDKTLDGLATIAIAQRANAAYSERLLNANANMWLGLLAAWGVAAVLLSLMLEFSLATFLLGVVLPLLPAMLDVLDQRRTTKAAGVERRALAEGIERFVRREQSAAYSEKDLLVWQDQLYALRKDSPLVPNLVYKRTRVANERAMQAAAAELGEAAKATFSKDAGGGR